MASNQLFPDWVTGDLITAAKLNQMKNDLIPWAQLGQANGPASLDSAGKLAQPRRVLDVVEAYGVTSSPSTTSAIGSYVLPDPRVSVTLQGSEAVILLAYIRLSKDVGSYARASIVRSSDGGSTWSGSLGKATYGPPAGGSHMPTLAFFAINRPGPGSHTYGLSIGGTAADGTTTADGTERGLVAIVVDY